MSAPRTTASAGPGAPSDTAPAPASVLRLDSGAAEVNLSFDRLREAVRSGEGMLWVDLDLSQPAQAALLGEVFHFHPLAIEDAFNPISRVKVDEYPDFMLIVARVVGFRESTPDPYDLDTANLNVFLGKRVVVTAHVEPLPVIAELMKRLATNHDLMDRGPARVAYLALDAAVDAYFPVLDGIDEFVDDLEQRVFGHFDEHLLHEIFKVKRLVISLRRFLSPQREVLGQLANRPSPLLPPETQLYFRDVYDHMLRITDSLDSFRDLLSSTLDGYLTQVSNRLGKVSKSLAIVGALSVPFVVVAGVYGMNFDFIPLQHHRYGFEIMLGLQLLLGLLFLVGLRLKRML
ncbi:MAG TPA: magnesium/cobalt transporter CorA [Gemmatimonadaceae bacterium]|nr:magnesium/cobalt transporter CorA [Gemmatimonadaceae bacterium]